MLHIYSGNGKGKTTAGFGLVLRQAGYERRVAVAQFLKDGTSGELRALQALSCVKEHWDLEIILTGRNPSQELLDICDYHTEMVEHRHPYQKGIAARKGVEY